MSTSPNKKFLDFVYAEKAKAKNELKQLNQDKKAPRPAPASGEPDIRGIQLPRDILLTEVRYDLLDEIIKEYLDSCT